MAEKKLFVGIDIGSTTTEAMLLDEDGARIAKAQVLTGIMLEEAAEKALVQAMEQAGASRQDIAYCVSTGYGRDLAGFADYTFTEIACHAKGAHAWFPEARGVIDIGGQDSKAIRINADGGIVDFAMNDKCAAGTGRFLDVMANIMGMSVGEMGRQSLKAEKAAPVSSICTVFAESEVISLVSKKEATPYEIMAGIHNSVVRRVNMLVAKAQLEPPIVMTGGVAQNVGVVRGFEQLLHTDILVPEDPQGVGALGAAILARRRWQSLQSN